MPFEKSCDADLGASKNIGVASNNRSCVFVTMFSLTSLFTLGLGIAGEAWMNFSTRLIFAIGAGLCSAAACEYESLTTPKIVSAARCTAIETIHAQNVMLPLRETETILCFILIHNFHL